MTKKIVINTCYGGFSISEKALFRLAELKGITLYPEKTHTFFTTYWTVPTKPEGILSNDDFHRASMEDRRKSNRLYEEYTMDNRPSDRSDPDLVKVVEELGDEASGDCACLKVIEIPDDVEYTIEEYDGNEWIAETHRRWG